MRFYRNIHHCNLEGREIVWFTNKAEAVQEFNRLMRSDTNFMSYLPSEDGEYTDYEEENSTKAEPVDITPTKAGIFKALKDYASHNDNG